MATTMFFDRPDLGNQTQVGKTGPIGIIITASAGLPARADLRSQRNLLRSPVDNQTEG